MQSIMMKTLLSFSSLGMMLLLTGCFGTYPAPVVVISSPELVYPDYNETKPFKISGKKQNGVLILTPAELSRISTKIIEQKYQIITLKSIIKSGNNWQPELIDGESTTQSFFGRFKVK